MNPSKVTYNKIKCCIVCHHSINHEDHHNEMHTRYELCDFIREPLTKMSSLDVARSELGLLVLYLNKAEARDKLCRAIQYGSRFVSNGEPGTAQNVEKSTSLARKVFRLLKVRILSHLQLTHD